MKLINLLVNSSNGPVVRPVNPATTTAIRELREYNESGEKVVVRDRCQVITGHNTRYEVYGDVQTLATLFVTAPDGEITNGPGVE